MESALAPALEQPWYTTTLPAACPQSVMAGVQMLADAACEAMRANPFRYQYAALHVAELTREMRPLYVRDCPQRLIGIYDQLPSFGRPLGSRLFVVGFLDHRCCAGCCTAGNRRPMTVDVRLDLRFPLDFRETRYAFSRHFGIIEWRLLQTHPAWVSAPPAAETPAAETPVTPRAQTAAPPKSGAPLCASTQKLLERMEKLDDPRDNRFLLPEWLLWYIEEHGYEPTDKDGSFRHAARTCLRHLERRRKGLGGSPSET